MGKICGIVGSGTEGFGEATALWQALDALLLEGVDEFAVAMDRWDGLAAARTVLEIKRTHPALRLTCLLLWEEQAADWPEGARADWFDAFAASDREVMLERRRSGETLVKRDRWLAEHCDCLLVLHREGPGTAWSAEELARRRGIPVRRAALDG